MPASSRSKPIVRVMELSEVAVRIDYFHCASDEYLTQLGVDRTLLPDREEWFGSYRADYARPIGQRRNYNLIWELDDVTVGFSSTDQITFGEQAFLHLHIVDPSLRHRGLGAEFAQASAAVYFDALHLKRLFCEPNAFNTAPNRTVQRAGFRFVSTQHTSPGPINFAQVTNRWVLERPDVGPEHGLARSESEDEVGESEVDQ